MTNKSFLLASNREIVSLPASPTSPATSPVNIQTHSSAGVLFSHPTLEANEAVPLSVLVIYCSEPRYYTVTSWLLLHVHYD